MDPGLECPGQGARVVPYPWTWSKQRDSVSDPTIWTYDDEVTFKAQRYLFDRAREPDSDPFCLVASYIHPHDPYITRAKYWDLYQDQDIDMPRYGATDGAGRSTLRPTAPGHRQFRKQH